MAVNRTQAVRVYGLSDPTITMAPLPIIARRDPGTRDLAELATVWLNTVAGTAWILAGISANVANWQPSPVAGATTLASLVVNPGNATVTAGNLTVTAGDLTVGGTSLLTGDVTAGGNLGVTADATVGGTLGVTGATTLDGVVTINNDVAVTGDITITGDFDLTDTASISLTSTNNAAGAIALLTNGGAAETLTITSAQGTGAGAVSITATAGGITTASAGLTTISSSRNNAQAILLSASAGGIDISAVGSAGEDIDILATGSSVNVTSTEDAAQAIYLRANGGVSETVQLHADQGTAVNSVYLLSDVGGLTLEATGLASADAINLVATAGGIDMDSALQTNVASSEAAADALRFVASDAAGGIDVDCGTGGIAIDSTGAFSIDGAAASNITTTGAGIDLTLSSVLGSVLVSSTEDAALAIYLHANGGTSESVDIHSDQGTGVASINIHSDVGGVTVASGLASADAINLAASAGGVDVDGALQVNIASSQAAVADAVRIVASAADGGIDIDAGTGGITVDSTGAISLDGAAASNFTLTGAFDLTLSSSAGSVIVSGGEAVADAVQITASNAAGGLDLNAGTGGVAVDAVGGSIALTAGTGANGSITLTSTGTGDIVLNSDDTMLLDADGVLELNSSAGAINIGNDADAQAINIGSAGVRPIQVGNASAGTTVLLLGPANIGVTLQNSIRIMTGAGSPDTVVTAPAGSLWLRTDPAGATSRLYINTDSATAWTNITCAA